MTESSTETSAEISAALLVLEQELLDARAILDSLKRKYTMMDPRVRAAQQQVDELSHRLESYGRTKAIRQMERQQIRSSVSIQVEMDLMHDLQKKRFELESNLAEVEAQYTPINPHSRVAQQELDTVLQEISDSRQRLMDLTRAGAEQAAVQAGTATPLAVSIEEFSVAFKVPQPERNTEDRSTFMVQKGQEGKMVGMSYGLIRKVKPGRDRITLRALVNGGQGKTMKMRLLIHSSYYDREGRLLRCEVTTEAAEAQAIPEPMSQVKHEFGADRDLGKRVIARWTLPGHPLTMGTKPVAGASTLKYSYELRVGAVDGFDEGVWDNRTTETCTVPLK
jgi:hypothetical protein